ncbi:MAG TPA: hypothetical protein VLD16_08970 [Gaiellaceae bacterium]|nr:hypothetical protein [Gaiellaceae bacterium]
MAPLLSTLLKTLIDRARPPNGLLHPVGASFPSGHATYAGATCVALVLLFTKPGTRRRWWWTGHGRLESEQNGEDGRDELDRATDRSTSIPQEPGREPSPARISRLSAALRRPDFVKATLTEHHCGHARLRQVTRTAPIPCSCAAVDDRVHRLRPATAPGLSDLFVP